VISPVVPAPVQGARRNGPAFLIGPGLRIVVGKDPMLVAIGTLLAGDLGRAHRVSVPVVQEAAALPGQIRLRLTNSPVELSLPDGLAPELAAEAYRL
jgi:hypothetical protein